MMDLNLDVDQRDLVATARRFVERTFDTASQAESVNGEAATEKLLAQLAPLGWPGLALPEVIGGADGSLLDLCLVLEELGRRGVATPLACSTTASRLVVDAGGILSHADLLGRAAAGNAVLTIAQMSPGVGDEWSKRPAVGHTTASGWTLIGAFSLVPFAHDAEAIVVEADLAGRGLSLVVVPRSEVSVRRQRVIGGEPRSAVVLHGASIDPDHVLETEGERVTELVARARDVTALLLAAHTVGAAEGALQLSVTWANDRQQFGRPIGSFQTVSNRCADMRLGIDAARLLVWEAAWSVDSEKPDAGARVATAKSYLNEIGDTVVVNSHQVHGALGYSTEYPLHVLTRAIKSFQTTAGTSSVQLERIAVELGL